MSDDPDFVAARRAIVIAAAVCSAASARPDEAALRAAVVALADALDSATPLHPRIAGSAPYNLVDASRCELLAFRVLGDGSLADLTGGVLRIASKRCHWLGQLLDNLLPVDAARFGADLAEAGDVDVVALAESLLRDEHF